MKNIEIKMSNLHKIIISSILFLIYGVLAGYFGIYGLSKYIREAENKIIINKIELDKKYKNAISQKRFLSKTKLVGDEMAKIESIYINKRRLLDFVTNIESAAAVNGVEQTINISDTADIPGPVKTTINLTAKGPFGNVLNFIEEIESFSYYVNVVSLSMQKTANGVIASIIADGYVK
jgi:hypothetical protein